MVDMTTPDDLVRGMDDVVRDVRWYSVHALAPDTANKPLRGYKNGRTCARDVVHRERQVWLA
jgi:hypothetical protein